MPNNITDHNVSNQTTIDTIKFLLMYYSIIDGFNPLSYVKVIGVSFFSLSTRKSGIKQRCKVGLDFFKGLFTFSCNYEKGKI